MSNLNSFIQNPEKKFVFNQENADFESLIDLFLPFDKSDSRKSDLVILKKVISTLNFDFYKNLLPKIVEWASDHQNQLKPIELLFAGRSGRVVLSSKQIRYILSNAFFLNVSEGFGSLDLSILYRSVGDPVAEARIRCLIEYFRLSSEEKDQEEEREISIERFHYQNEVPSWEKQNLPIKSSKFSIDAKRMEDFHEAQGFVDFANKRIHIFQVIPSATQEEVLFSCCPEAFVSMLVCEELTDDEIVIIRGCRRFVDYSGYGRSFRYEKTFDKPNPSLIQDILVMDACYSSQFNDECIDRDLNKVWATFHNSKNKIIVTGHWGCGAFGGNFFLKFLQQICAATSLGDHFQRLDYSVFGDQSLADKFQSILVRLEEKEQTVADVYRMMKNFDEKKTSNKRNTFHFDSYLDRWLQSLSNDETRSNPENN